jgi:hypothetical protein
LVNQQFKDTIDCIRKEISEKNFDINKDRQTYFKILESNPHHFTQFTDMIQKQWLDFNELNQKRLIKKTYTNFLYVNFEKFLSFYLQIFFGFNEKSLELIIKENISESTLFLEYKYYLAPEEIEEYEILSQNFKKDLHGLLFFTEYLYSLISVLGILIRRTLKEKIIINLDCAVIKGNNNEKFLNFLILVRDDKKEIYLNYLNLILFYFLKQFKGIPNDIFDKLLSGREKLYQIALDRYPHVKEELANLLYYFYKKCKLLENFCPLLDFLNYVCSRVEDSIFSKIDVIKKGFLNNFDYTADKKNALIKIFDFLDKKCTLYSTFQANNLPSQKAQFNLFLLIMQYYFGNGSLEALEVGNLLFFPDIFKNSLSQYNKFKKKRTIGSNTINEIRNFISYLSVLSNIDNINLIFKKIFNFSVSEVNYQFFRTFLKSFNLKVFELINNENQILSEDPKNDPPLNFNITVDHISRMLYVLIDKVFLQSNNPDDLSKNFIDPKGRYLGKNIAFKVLELFIFQDMNFSDDIWPEYLISLNSEKIKKEMIKYTTISDKHFFSNEDLMKFSTIYNLQSFNSDLVFEEWIINALIIPLNEFILKINKSIENISDKNEINQKLYNLMSRNIKTDNLKTMNEIKQICDRLSLFWVNDK